MHRASCPDGRMVIPQPCSSSWAYINVKRICMVLLLATTALSRILCILGAVLHDRVHEATDAFGLWWGFDHVTHKAPCSLAA